MPVKKSPGKKKSAKTGKKSVKSPKKSSSLKNKVPAKKQALPDKTVPVKAVPVKKGISKPQPELSKNLGEKKIITNSESREPIDKALAVKRVRKSSKKQAITLPPPPPIEVSNHPKSRVRHILVSQPKPSENDKNPYLDLG